MKMDKWRELTREDLERREMELRDQLLKTRIKVQTKQVENTAQLAGMRRDIARIRTLLREMDRQGVNTTMAAAKDKAKAESKR